MACANPPQYPDGSIGDAHIDVRTGEALVNRGLVSRHHYSTYLPVYRLTLTGTEVVRALREGLSAMQVGDVRYTWRLS